MPIPQPNKNEDKQAFVARCMSNEIMKKDYPDSQQRVAICLGATQNKANLIQDVADNLAINQASWDDEWDEFVVDVVTDAIYDEDGKVVAAEKNGRKVTLNKPFRTPDGPKKFSVYVKNDKGNVVKVNFGDPNMKIKKNIPERRRSFRARHKCDQQKDKTTPAYWSCKMW
jgi:hypothetical protein